MLSGGDDASYVNGIAHVVENDEVAYAIPLLSFHLAFAQGLATFTRSLSAYRQAFGDLLLFGKNHRLSKKAHSHRVRKKAHSAKHHAKPLRKPSHN